MPGSAPARGQTGRYGGVDDDSSTATASELESLEGPAPRAPPAAASWRRGALALGGALAAAALLRARRQPAQVDIQVAVVGLAAESPEDCDVRKVGRRRHHVCHHRGCDNWQNLTLTPNATAAADLESCLDLCSQNAECGAVNFQPDGCPGGMGVKAGACQLFRGGCVFGHNDCWDYYLPVAELPPPPDEGMAVARMAEVDPNTPSSTLKTIARRGDRYLDVKDEEKFHKGDWIYIVNQAVDPFESEEAQVLSTNPLKIDRECLSTYPPGALVSVVPPIEPTPLPTLEPTPEPTPVPTPVPTTPAPTPAPTPLRAAVSMLSQAAHVGDQTLYVMRPEHFREGDIVSVSSESFRDLCNVTGVFGETLECKKGLDHAYPKGSPVIFIPLEVEDATQPTQSPTAGSGELLVGHAELTSYHQAGADRLYLTDNADFPDNCIIVLVNPSMQMVGRHLVKPGGSTHRTVAITPSLVRDWPTGTTAAVVSSFTSATYLEADSGRPDTVSGVLTLQVAEATAFDVHDVVMVGTDDTAYAERREVTKILVNSTGEYLVLAKSKDAHTTYTKEYKAGTYLTNAQAQTILMAPAEAGDKHLQVDTSLFVEVGDEVQIDSGSGYSEKATVKESEQKMVLVLDQGLQHSYPAGSAVTTLPQDTPPR